MTPEEAATRDRIRALSSKATRIPARHPKRAGLPIDVRIWPDPIPAPDALTLPWTDDEEEREAAARALRGEGTPEAFAIYDEARAQFALALEPIASSPALSRKRRRRWADDGSGDLDVDRYVSADPACWVRATPRRSAPVVRLAYRINRLKGAEIEYVRSCAATAAAADVLTRLGYGVELVALVVWAIGSEGTAFPDAAILGNSNGQYWTTLAYFHEIKSALGPLDVGRMLGWGSGDVHARSWPFRSVLTGQRRPDVTAVTVPPEVLAAFGISYYWGERDVTRAQNLPGFVSGLTEACERLAGGAPLRPCADDEG